VFVDIVLIGGLWLRNDVWAATASALAEAGHRVFAVALSGADDENRTATLDDQLADVLAVVDSSVQPLVVGHSAASALAWLAADRRPADIAGVVMIGGFPGAHEASYADFFDLVDGVMPFPGWAAFDGPDSIDLDESARTALEAAMVPVPAGVAHGTVILGNEARFAVPVTVICPEFGPADVEAWIAEGNLPELARADHVALVDIDSGHWPMITQPQRLAALIDTIASSTVH
jgi:pimeloyl-ACP methyl ester carboxylesterase